MKYRSLKFTQHPILGNLELDFRHDGRVYDNIIFAGENGAGKTVLLEFLYSFSSDINFAPSNGSVEIEFELSDSDIDAINQKRTTSGHSMLFPNGLTNRVVTYKYDHTQNHGSRGQVTFMGNDGNPQHFDGYHFSPVFKAIYSEVAVNFNTKEIDNVTAKDIDTLQNNKVRSGRSSASDIKQLLIDINSIDAEELQQWTDANPGMVPPEALRHRRIKRFTDSFNQMFDSKRFKSVENIDGHKDVRFTENSREMSIDTLSSGEKQIVFRGAFLLKDLKKIDGHILLIDEPELSMHPKWEQKILGFFTNLFVENGKQKTQIFFATHSEQVVKKALDNMDNNLVVVLSRGIDGVTSRNLTAPDKLKVITSAEANYLAFGLYTSDYHIQLYGTLQVQEDKEYIKDCDTYITTTAEYKSDEASYSKQWKYKGTTYTTLPTYVRNKIDHPDNGQNYMYTDEELEKSTNLLRDLIH